MYPFQVSLLDSINKLLLALAKILWFKCNSSMRMFQVSFFLYSDGNSKMTQSSNSFGRKGKLEDAAREKKKKGKGFT